jgi:hypothetical protein
LKNRKRQLPPHVALQKVTHPLAAHQVNRKKKMMVLVVLSQKMALRAAINKGVIIFSTDAALNPASVEFKRSSFMLYQALCNSSAHL